MERYLYEAVFTPYDNGYEVEFPELGLFTQGHDLSDAAYMAQDLLHTYVSEELKEGGSVSPVGQFGSEHPAGAVVMGIMTMAEAGSADEETMTAEEAAETLGVSESRIYAMIRSGALHARKQGRMYEISAQDVMHAFNAPRRKAGRPKKDALMA